MKNIAFVLVCLILSGFNNQNEGTLLVSIANVTKTGKVNIAVYSRGDDFPSDKYLVKSAVGTCNSAKCSFQFETLPFDSYAIAIYQDVNGNGKLDTGTFGVPNEPFAFSNNFRPKWGGPNFDKCKFDFVKDKQSISINMINSLFGNE